ncbi:Lyzozyme M1 (1,4-beta-N-acetylmuramidase), GH25 family [Lachnospiraceae bacterium KHCPX20]|nr:Lyzozyme M1 (1,4-beta-N-acetylmuramidase), GH25 family [Lachnospiraceae bacterium KHCPX20]
MKRTIKRLFRTTLIIILMLCTFTGSMFAITSYAKKQHVSRRLKHHSFVSKSPLNHKKYYHKKALSDKKLCSGIDVSWWQASGPGSKKSRVNWKKAAKAGVSFAFVRAGSRDSKDHKGRIFFDTSANSHIKGAKANGIDVGLYFYSQARNKKQARQEAKALLKWIKKYHWEVDLPLVLDRENGNYGYLREGMLSRAKETAVCQSFINVLHRAGYKTCLYVSVSWLKNRMYPERFKHCSFWLPRYNHTITLNDKKGTPYKDLPVSYSFWQYGYVKNPSFYKGYIDMNYWYF